jgi:hypothetical protein
MKPLPAGNEFATFIGIDWADCQTRYLLMQGVARALHVLDVLWCTLPNTDSDVPRRARLGDPDLVQQGQGPWAARTLDLLCTTLLTGRETPPAAPPTANAGASTPPREV